MVAVGSGAGAEGTQAEGTQEFVVLYTEGASTADAQAAIAAAGGTIVSENADVGVATVQTTNADFAAAAQAAPAIEGTARERRHRLGARTPSTPPARSRRPIPPRTR